jgi:hypothetical protein
MRAYKRGLHHFSRWFATTYGSEYTPEQGENRKSSCGLSHRSSVTRMLEK